MGVDLAEDHHDACNDGPGRSSQVTHKRRALDSVAGIGDLHGLIAELGEFGDDRFSGPKSHKNYAGQSPVTKVVGPLGVPGPIRPQPPPRPPL